MTTPRIILAITALIVLVLVLILVTPDMAARYNR